MREEDIKIFIDGIENPAEPNQVLKDAAERYEKYSERFDNDESAIGNSETWGRRLVEDKQETLEEAAERLYSDKEYPMYGEIRRDGFINGAKWQQERMYSEEEVIKILYQFHYDLVNSKFDTKEEWFEQFKKK
jgi:hypothetical protein